MRVRFAAYPYIIWIILTIISPLVLILYYSLTIKEGAGIILSLQNFMRFFDPIYINVLVRSMGIALISTFFCLILGYPAAMILAAKKISVRNSLILLFVIPMWMNFLLRTYAWMALLENSGLINRFLNFLGFQGISLMYNNHAVILGMVYNFLPFMVLPIYSVLVKIDKSLIEAAMDLGANSFLVFRKVIFPLSLPGVISGITMVFLPAVTNFVIPRLLGGGHYYLIGNLIEQQFLYVGDWHFGSSLSVVMMVLILISMAVMSKHDRALKGGALW